MKHITINDLAKQLGLSKSTVSRALSNDHNISKETKDRVVTLADHLGYRRNELAVNLRQKQTRSIGIIVPEIVTPFFMSVITELQNTLNVLYGYRVLISQSNEDSDIELAHLRMMEDFRVDGILISVCHSKNNIPEYQRLKQKGIPLVFFDRSIPLFSASKIQINDYTKSFFLVEHLIRSGRKRIMHIAGPDYIYNSVERKKAYLDALTKFSIQHDPALFFSCELSVDATEERVKKAFDDGIQIDAVFCFTETQALGVKKLLEKRKILVPEDVAIACMSGTILSTLVFPTLTTVEQPVSLIADAAIELLLEKINDPKLADRTIIVDAEIKIRESSNTTIKDT